MKILLPLLFTLQSVIAFNQITIEENVYNPTEEYCLIKATESGKGVIISIDFGQEDKSTYWKDKNYLINTETGKPVQFNSVIAALNFMNGYGWIFTDAYAITVDMPLGGSQNVYHYLMHRMVKPQKSPQGGE
ncbi:MAG: hypothetical protein KA954_10610 [Chitinophagales bacterium]|nr:hypothetical protein [Chitinophagales bacterium]MBP8754181.1 hypothetical protein [Chitinophagales bacterium]MBP9704659.1 hypothetical protein [Chitinophagales bacterium]